MESDDWEPAINVVWRFVMPDKEIRCMSERITGGVTNLQSGLILEHEAL